MKKFHPEMKVVRFGAEDVIVTSGALTVVFDNKFGNGVAGDGSVTFEGVPYKINKDDTSEYSNLYAAIFNKNTGFDPDAVVDHPNLQDNPLTFDGILQAEALGLLHKLGTGWDGTYEYDATSNAFRFIKQ